MITKDDAAFALVELSQFSGARFDLVQAGGGNSSVKYDDNRMLIKASGMNLSQVTLSQGYVSVNYSYICQCLNGEAFFEKNKKNREQYGKVVMNDAIIDSHEKNTTSRPSIETFLHAILNTFTLHTHPVSVNIIAAQDSWIDIFSSLFPESVCVSYATPGVDLTLQLIEKNKEFYEKCKKTPEVIFLQNHGLIVSSSSYERVIELTQSISLRLESFLNVSYKGYRNVSYIQKSMKDVWLEGFCVYKTDDRVILENLKKEDLGLNIWPFCPDTLVYCGLRPLHIDTKDGLSQFKKYQTETQDYPRVILFEDDVYFVGHSIKKCRESEELFKFHLLVIVSCETKINRLSKDEARYLSNWDSEKYRQEV